MFLLMLLNGVPAVAEVDGAGWLVAAEQSLKQALAQAYPQVAEWAIEPLIGKRQRANLPKTDALQARAAHLGKRSAVRLTWVEGRHRASTTVWFAVRGLQSVPTATSDIRVGAALTPDMAEYAERDVFVSSCATLSTPAALTSTRAKKGLRMGEAICENAVEPRCALPTTEWGRLRSARWGDHRSVNRQSCPHPQERHRGSQPATSPSTTRTNRSRPAAHHGPRDQQNQIQITY